jgi:hypothetical protein
MVIYNNYIEHIVWTNVASQQLMVGRIVEVYWTDHKPIYFASNLLDYVSPYIPSDNLNNGLFLPNNCHKHVRARNITHLAACL